MYVSRSSKIPHPSPYFYNIIALQRWCLMVAMVTNQYTRFSVVIYSIFVNSPTQYKIICNLKVHTWSHAIREHICRMVKQIWLAHHSHSLPAEKGPSESECSHTSRSHTLLVFLFRIYLVPTILPLLISSGCSLTWALSTEVRCCSQNTVLCLTQKLHPCLNKLSQV